MYYFRLLCTVQLIRRYLPSSSNLENELAISEEKLHFIRRKFSFYGRRGSNNYPAERYNLWHILILLLAMQKRITYLYIFLRFASQKNHSPNHNTPTTILSFISVKHNILWYKLAPVVCSVRTKSFFVRKYDFWPLYVFTDPNKHCFFA